MVYRYTINLDDQCKQIVDEESNGKVSAFVRKCIANNRKPKEQQPAAAEKPLPTVRIKI